MLAPVEVFAQRLIGLGTWDGALEAGFAWDRQETNGNGSSDTWRRTRYDERLTIRNTGAYYVDPRLVSTSFSGTFGLVQEQDHFSTGDSSTSGTLLGYTFNTVFLSEKPYSATTFASLNQNVRSLDFGGRTEYSFENRGATFRLREDSVLQDLGVPYFTSTLGARQEHTKEETTNQGQTFKRDETRWIANYEGNKGFETSDLHVRYEFVDQQDKELPTNTFQSQTADLDYSLDFGENLNRRWTSRLHYFTRNGLAGSTYLSADEELKIDHYKNLFTDYRYLLTRFENEPGTTTTQNSVTTTQTAIAKIQHQLYRSLTETGTIGATLQDLPNGEHKTYAGQVNFDYDRALPWNGRITAGTAARYQIDDIQLDTSTIDVVDEPHTAPIPLGGSAGFLLNNPFVIVSTIVMVDARGGARLPTTLGVDYVIISEGDFTKIVPLATSSVIQAGDPLLVSYTYSVPQNLKYSTVFWRANLNVDFRWIGVFLSHEQSDQTLLSGQDNGFLTNRRLDTARLELRGDWERIRGSASAQYQALDSTQVAYTSWEYGQFLTVLPMPGLVLNLSAHEAFFDYTIPKRVSTRLSTRGDLTWTPLPSLFVNVYAGLRSSEDSELPSESVREAGVRIRWTYGKVEVVPNFRWVEFERGPTRNTDTSFDVRVIRRF